MSIDHVAGRSNDKSRSFGHHQTWFSQNARICVQLSFSKRWKISDKSIFIRTVRKDSRPSLWCSLLWTNWCNWWRLWKNYFGNASTDIYKLLHHHNAKRILFCVKLQCQMLSNSMVILRNLISLSKKTISVLCCICFAS